MRQFDAAATAQALPFAALVPALRRAFQLGARVPLRHHHAIGSAGVSLLMPAWREGGRYAVKVVNLFPGNAARGLPALHAMVLLFSATTGELLAQMDGGELTARRTAAASALAASYLARQDASRLLVVGAGRVAALLPAAYRAVRSIQQVQVFARRPEAAAVLVASLREQGFQATPCVDLNQGLAECDIVSCATLSATPLLHGAALHAGMHVDLIGGFTPAMREADGDCLARARVYVDTLEAMAKAGDITHALLEGAFNPAALQGTLEQLCRGERSGRGTTQEITLFKSVGTALEDLAAAELVVDGAQT